MQFGRPCGPGAHLRASQKTNLLVRRQLHIRPSRFLYSPSWWARGHELHAASLGPDWPARQPATMEQDRHDQHGQVRRGRQDVARGGVDNGLAQVEGQQQHGRGQEVAAPLLTLVVPTVAGGVPAVVVSVPGGRPTPAARPARLATIVAMPAGPWGHRHSPSCGQLTFGHRHLPYQASHASVAGLRLGSVTDAGVEGAGLVLPPLQEVILAVIPAGTTPPDRMQPGGRGYRDRW
jgi:hypothetical protein